MPSARPASPREDRRRTILDLVQSRAVRSQAELRGLLEGQGIEVNQATLSRDLRDMGLVKGSAGYVVPIGPSPPPDESGPALALLHALREWLRSAEVAQNQLVLKTPAGGAQPLALAIDRAQLADVVGTLGGDDTVLLITKDGAAARRVRTKLLRMQREARP